MRSAERSRRVRREFVRAALCVAGVFLVALVVGSCSRDMFEPLSRVLTPDSVVAVPLRLKLVSVRWTKVNDHQGVSVVGYKIERRENLAGAFHQVAYVLQSSTAELTWLDTDIEPAVFYGYRVITVDQFGNEAAPSAVAGLKSPPLPGIEVRATSVVSVSSATDPDGYDLTILGPDTIRTTIGQTATRIFSPLKLGTYQVSIGGFAAQCTPTGPTTTSVVVSDTVAATITLVTFDVRCRDATLGDITVTLHGTGRAIDTDVDLDLLGQATDHSLPDSGVVSMKATGVSLASSVTPFANLHPGTYDITLRGVADNCTLAGPAKKTVTVTPLGNATVQFDATCRDTSAAGAGPFFVNEAFTPAEAAKGARITLRSTLDLTADATQQVQGIQMRIVYDPTVLHFEKSTVGDLENLTVNSSTPGLLRVIAATLSAPLVGAVRIMETEFTVLGDSGTSTDAKTTVDKASAADGSTFEAKVSPEDGTFTVGGGAAGNQAPVAHANGPYSGGVSAAISFTANGSVDADGSITAYSWAFGDGQTGTGATLTHAYTSAGTYTATLTVTDNGGATATSTATVTITATPPPPNQAPIAAANGPYSAQAGVALSLSSTGSHDNDGTIASYAWNLGNGQTATGPSPSVSYPTAGTYTITLTVTDDKGATSTDQATVTVAPPAADRPMIWSETFGPVDLTNNLVAITINYDTRADVADTPGPEALETFVLDSLKWNPAVLQFFSVNLGPGVTGTSNQAQVSSGNLSLRGTLATGFQQGLIQIAVVRFKIIGAAGAETTTSTFLGSLVGPTSTNGYVYNSKTRIVEGTFKN
jgi:PKD repeat protein